MKPLTWQDKLEHAGYALAVQALVALAAYVLGVATAAAAWMGACAAIGLFAGREHRDDENRHRSDPAWRPWRSFNPLRWSLDGQLDLLAPVAAVVGVAVAVTLQSGS